MSSNSILEALKAFLNENVTPGITLQKPNDNDVNDYKLVHPQVYIGWIPPKGYLPNEMDSMIPCLVVGYDENSDDGEGVEFNIRISAVVYKPGTYDLQGSEVVKYTPSFEGYQDLLNLLDRTKAELIKTRIIKNMATVQLPIRQGMYQQEQPYPYWYGWISFPITTSTGLYVPTIAQQYL